MSLNKVMLIGNVGKDPEVRYLDGNSSQGAATKVATFPLATSERYRDRNGELRENTEWHNISLWRGLADIAEKFIHKGSQIYLEGHLRTRQWTDQSGNKRYSTEIVGDNMQLLGRRDQDGTQQGSQEPSGAQGYQQGGYQQRAYQAAQPQAGGYQAQSGYQQPSPSQLPPEPVDFSAESPTDDLPF